MVIIIQIHQDVYGTLKEMKSFANNANLSINNSESFKYKAALVAKTKDFANQKVL